MKLCTHFEGETDENGVFHHIHIIDVSLVEDNHTYGRDEDGSWHWPGGEP